MEGKGSKKGGRTTPPLLADDRSTYRWSRLISNSNSSSADVNWTS
jgi:hypothetical protein